MSGWIQIFKDVIEAVSVAIVIIVCAVPMSFGHRN